MYEIPHKKQRLRPKKRTNNPHNKKFQWMRQELPECIVCGDYGEIHHIDIGKGDDTRVCMICHRHHSAQSNDGLHKDPKRWYERFEPFIMLEARAIEINDEWEAMQ